MHVAHVIPNLSPRAGGPSRSVPNLCRHIAARGVEVTLLAGNHGAENTSEGIADIPGVRVAKFAFRSMAYDIPLGLSELVGQISRDVDLMEIHSVWNFTTTISAKAAYRAGIPYIIAPRGMLHSYCLQNSHFKKRLYWSAVQRLCIQRAAGVHFLNAAEKRGSPWVTQLGVHAFTVPNGTDVAALENVQGGMLGQMRPETEGRKVMLFLGRLHWIKGLELQLEALGLLAPKHDDLVWVLLGPDDGEWAKLKARAEEMGIADRLIWLGLMSGPDRFSVVADADVVLQTSHYEAHSMTITETLALGRPLVITRSCNFEELGDAGAGFVVQEDPAQIAEAIDKILTDSALRDRMVESGRTYAREKLNWNRVAEQMVEEYQKILDAQAASAL